GDYSPLMVLLGFSSDPALLCRYCPRPHKDGQSRERILPTTATPPCPSGLTIAASPKLIWMPSAALIFAKCAISTVLVPVSGCSALGPCGSPGTSINCDITREPSRGPDFLFRTEEPVE